MFRFKTNYLFILFFMATMVVVGCSSESKTIAFTPNEYDFGNTPIGDVLEKEIIIKNKFGSEVTITALDLDGSPDYEIKGGFSVPRSLAKNEEVKVTIKFEPQSPGDLITILTLRHNESDKPYTMKFYGVGVAVARIQVSDPTYDFDKKLINKSHDYDIEIENIGTSPLSINSLIFAGPNATLFSVANTPMQINPGAKDKITITFSPIVLGNFNAELQIMHNAVNEDNPYKISVQGEGIDLDPQITLSTGTTWDFGAVPTTINAVQICEIENTGIDPLTVTSAVITNHVDFSVYKLEDSNGATISFPQVIAVGAKILLYVEFTPSTTSMYNDTLVLDHDGTNEPKPLNVPLTGSGRTPTDVNISYTGAITSWTVPAGASMVRIEIWGGQGGNGGGAGGKGSRMRGDFILRPGDVIKILVGQQGGGIPTSALGGGGGATHIWKDGATDPMIVAGAGGGGAYGTGGTPGIDAVITNDGVDGGGTYAVGGHGTNGNGGVKPNYPQRLGGGGAGWKTDGCDGANSASGTVAGGGKCPANGGTGGAMGGTNTSNGAGGFGGGGGAQGRNGASAAGGGGGYSGGGPGAESPTSSTYTQAAGGAGGSYNDGLNQDNTAAVHTGNGKVVITY